MTNITKTRGKPTARRRDNAIENNPETSHPLTSEGSPSKKQRSHTPTNANGIRDEQKTAEKLRAERDREIAEACEMYEKDLTPEPSFDLPPISSSTSSSESSSSPDTTPEKNKAKEKEREPHVTVDAIPNLLRKSNIQKRNDDSDDEMSVEPGTAEELAQDLDFTQSHRATRSYMVHLAKKTGVLTKRPKHISETVWRKKSLRQRIAMVAKGGMGLDPNDIGFDEMKLVDEIKQYRNEQELRDSDFERLVQLANAYKAGSVNEESQKRYEVHINRYKEYMKTYGLDAMKSETLETYIIAMHHVYAGSTMWSVLSCLNYFYKRDYNHDTKTWTGVRMIMKAITANHVMKKAAVFEEEDMEEIFRRLREDINQDLGDPSDKKAYKRNAFNRNKALSQYIGITMFYYGMCRKSDIMRTCEKHVDKIPAQNGHESYYQVCLEPEASLMEDEEGVTMGGGKLAQGDDKRKNMMPLIYNLPTYITNHVDLYVSRFSEKMKDKKLKRGDRFIKNAQYGTVDTNVYSINTGKTPLGKWAKEWAQKLGKKDYERYTSHSWRRTAATNLVDNGGTERQVMIALGHKNAHTAKEYIDRSKKGIREREQMLNTQKKLTAPKTKVRPPPTVKEAKATCPPSPIKKAQQPHFPPSPMKMEPMSFYPSPPAMMAPQTHYPSSPSKHESPKKEPSMNPHAPPFYPYGMYGQQQQMMQQHMMQQQMMMMHPYFNPFHMNQIQQQQVPQQQPPQQPQAQTNSDGGHNIYGQNVTVNMYVSPDSKNNIDDKK